jgi:hypothetical protein
MLGVAARTMRTFSSGFGDAKVAGFPASSLKPVPRSST